MSIVVKTALPLAARGWAASLALGCGLLLAACATIVPDYQAVPSRAFADVAATPLGRSYAPAQARYPGWSGFRLINNGVSALLTRAALADVAERSIDIQYYIFDADESGAFLIERLIAAADRGVRVRLLLDDHELDVDDGTLVRIDAHPNIEVRLFNPFPGRARWTRNLQLLMNLGTLGNRMHNKVFAVDGTVAVMGGRNISNRYFEGRAESNFRDMDLLAAGDVVREVERSFDEYWNSRIAVSVQALGEAPAVDDHALHFAELRDEAAQGRGPYAEYGARRDEFVARVLFGAEDMTWAQGHMVAEPPLRQAAGADKSTSVVARALAIARQATHRELEYEVAYFVPGERGVKVLGDVAARGVRVRVMTNSLAATDVVPVHAGYAASRVALLAAGVELYEYRPDAKRPEPLHRLRLGSSGSALHAKVVVHDRRVVWIGSANFDPRSRYINTEAGLLIDSAELAAKVLASMERDYSPAQSWKLELERVESGEQRIAWIGERDGKPVRLSEEPGAGLLRRLGVGLFSILPGIEDLL